MDIKQIAILVFGSLSSIAVLCGLGFVIGYYFFGKSAGMIGIIIGFVIWATAAGMLWISASPGQV